MLSVQTLARRIRQRLHDTDEITYDDENILDCINCGLRFIRRTIAGLRPALLMTEHKGTLPANVSSIALDIRPIKIVNVTAGKDDTPLFETEMAFAIHKDISEAGVPTKFYLTGDKTINFYPIPVTSTPYTIRTVDDIVELTWDDNSPLPMEYDDFVVEYAAIRMSLGNEYDMTQENQLMANIVAQISKILTPPPAGLIVKGYWS